MDTSTHCRRCGKLHQPSALCLGGLSRRRFIFLGTAAAAAVMAGPLVELAPGPLPTSCTPLDFQTLDGLLKQFYEPALVEMINEPNYLMRHLMREREFFVSF